MAIRNVKLYIPVAASKFTVGTRGMNHESLSAILGTEWFRRASGPIVTLLLIAVTNALRVPLPALPLLLMLAVAYSVLVGGMAAGVVSSAFSVADAVYVYRAPGAPFHYAPDNLERLVIFLVMLPLVVTVVGGLRKRLDALLVRERQLRKEAEVEHDRTIGIIESITDGFFALDREWRYVYVNQQAEKLVGRPRAELQGQAVWDAFPPLVGSAWDRELHRAVEQQVAVHFEEFYAPLDTWFETYAYPSTDGLTIYLRSINERKRAEQALAARARQQAAVAALGQEALLGDDIPLLLEDAVRTLASTLEVELTKVLELLPDEQTLVMRAGVGWKDGVDHRVAAGARSQAGYTLASRQPVVVEDLRTETRFEGPSLLLDHGVVSGVSVIIPGRESPFGVLGAHSRDKRAFTEDDVHFLQAIANVLSAAIERERSGAELAESEQRFRQLAENVREVFYVVGANPTEVLYVNPAYEAVWGRPRATLLAQPDAWLEAIHPDDRPGIEKSLAERDSGFFDGEYRVVRPDGTVRWIHDRSSPVFDDSGRPYRVVGTAEDITQLKEASEAASRLAASEASVRARDEVLAEVAHDLRNPLDVISMVAAMLETPELAADERARHAKTIKRAVGSAARLIRDLLDVTRIEAGQLSIEPEALDVEPLVSEACNAYLQSANEKSITLECTVDDDLPRVSGDLDRVSQVLGNLLSNAVKFTPDGGRIRVRARRGPESVEFSVEDTGPGIAPEALPNVFDRFWRASPSGRKGLGLGLAIVKAIVSAHHGRVWAESEIGKGSVFHFSLPFDVPNGKALRPPGTPDSSAVQGASSQPS
jgi:PAS domain S-box-containing protein